ncbi:hypothetical protein GGS20DRAFT_526808 [Poronia punctata]|nr:hypothetical protein GGS20DRAFT_526808 [Poronia punctata]
MSVTSGITHLVESIMEMIQGVFSFIFQIFQFGLDTVVGLFTGLVDLAMGLFSGVVNFVEGTLGFAFHNFFMIGTGVAAVLAYMMYTQKRGTAPASRAIKN